VEGDSSVEQASRPPRHPLKASDGEAPQKLTLESRTSRPRKVLSFMTVWTVRASGIDTAIHEEARRTNALLAEGREAAPGRREPNPRHIRVALTIAQANVILDFIEGATSRNMPRGRGRLGAHIARGEKVVLEKRGHAPRQTRAALTIARGSAILDFTEAATSGNMPKGRRRPGAHIARPRGVDILNTRATLPSHLH